MWYMTLQVGGKFEKIEITSTVCEQSRLSLLSIYLNFFETNISLYNCHLSWVMTNPGPVIPIIAVLITADCHYIYQDHSINNSCNYGSVSEIVAHLRKETSRMHLSQIMSPDVGPKWVYVEVSCSDHSYHNESDIFSANCLNIKWKSSPYSRIFGIYGFEFFLAPVRTINLILISACRQDSRGFQTIDVSTWPYQVAFLCPPTDKHKSSRILSNHSIMLGRLC